MMHRHRLLTLTVATGFFLLAGCAKEAVPTDGVLPMRLAPTLAGQTKASLTTADLTDFYLQVAAGDPAYSYFVPVSKSGSAWTTPMALFWKDETTPETFCAARFGAYAFTANDFKNGIDLAVPADQSSQEGLNAADLLKRPAATVKYKDTVGGTLPVTLEHGLAKLNVVVSIGPEFYDDGLGLETTPITSVLVRGALAGFHFKPLTGEVTVKTGTQQEVSAFLSAYTPGTASAKTATATYELILPPQEIAADQLELYFCIGGWEYLWSNPSAVSLAAGTTRDLTVSVNDSSSPAPMINGHRYVEMGDGLKWATCNVGADGPEGYGHYFAWGETVQKTDYSWSTYAHGSSDHALTMYCTDTGYGEGGFWDMLYVLLVTDDAARHCWGGSWRMPTDDEWAALRDGNHFTWTWTTDYEGSGVNGMLVTSKVAGFEGNSIFLPAAGSMSGTDLGFDASWGLYWSSSLNMASPDKAKELYFGFSAPGSRNEHRYMGLSVRPVSY